jgi:hypothetical protein
VGDRVVEVINFAHFVAAWYNIYLYVRENQQTDQLLFNLLLMYGGSYMFRNYIAILRERS